MLTRLEKTFWWLPFGRVPEVSAVDLAEQLCSAAAPQLLDVRTATEWRRSRLRGAVNVPIVELKSRLDQLHLDPGRPLVAICLSAHRSIPAVRLLRANGFPDAKQLAGGMLAWWRARLPTTAGAARGEHDH